MTEIYCGFCGNKFEAESGDLVRGICECGARIQIERTKTMDKIKTEKETI